MIPKTGSPGDKGSARSAKTARRHFYGSKEYKYPQPDPVFVIRCAPWIAGSNCLFAGFDQGGPPKLINTGIFHFKTEMPLQQVTGGDDHHS